MKREKEKTMNNQEGLLTIKEAATSLNVSTVTIWRSLRNGDLVGVKIGRIWRIRPRDLQKFIRERRT